MDPSPTETSIELERLQQGRHHDPFALLGRHDEGDSAHFLALLPGAVSAEIVEPGVSLARRPDSDLFEGAAPASMVPPRYRLRWQDGDGASHTAWDPYCFPPQLDDRELRAFTDGSHRQAWRLLGARAWQADGIDGVLFSSWAPNAERVSVVGDFNRWDGRRHPLRSRGESGIWELFVPGLAAGTLYKFELRNRDDGTLHVKADPYARQCEFRPATASVVAAPTRHAWSDAGWLEQRAAADWLHAPLTIYEVHLGSWRRPDGRIPTYRELADELVPYVADLGFTHLELLPVTEHPYDASWGYQTTGYFAPTSRFGTPDDFRALVDACHAAGIGVLLDWVPGHFPRDAHGLARFDGSHAYEHADPHRGEQRDWGTLVFDFGRREVRQFLLSSALFWIEEMHIDGLRVDAVAAMIYLDYSREPGEWMPNVHGGRENLEAIDFLQELNREVHARHPGTLVIAEESTAWPMVSRPTWLGGLGFSMKWNMGWMNDTLDYFLKDPIHRHYHHDRLTFGLLYAFSENFVLPLSHDEVVHGKGPLIDRMPGDDWQRCANLRLLYATQYTLPGKKLLFMGNELGQLREWSHDRELDWHLLEQPAHAGIQTLVRDLNRLVRDHPPLHRFDFEAAGFAWIDCHDAAQSVLLFERRDGDDVLVIALNFTPVVRHGYRIGLPRAGRYVEILNSDSRFYGGSDVGNGELVAEPVAWMERDHSAVVTLPPLAAIVLAPV